MGNILDVNFGLVFWTLLNFLIFFLLLWKFGTKPIANGLKAREDSIRSNIDGAAKANEEATKLLNESQSKISQAQSEANEIIQSGKKQVEVIISKAKEEAEIVKSQKIKDVVKEIEISKENAINELRSEVADLVIVATEKILDEKIDKNKDSKLIESAIANFDKFNNN